MSEASRHSPGPREGAARSANDRLKDRWGSRLAWSVMGAVVLHAALFLLRPGWGLTPLEPLGDPGRSGAGWLTEIELPSGTSTGGGGDRAPGLTVGEPSDSARAGPDRPSAGPGSRPGDAGGSDAGEGSTRSVRDRLADATGPSLAGGESGHRPPRELPPRPAPEPEAEVSVRRSGGGAEGGTLSIGGRAATAGGSDTPSDDGPNLDRLRSLDPDVAVGLGSSEVLLRNPGEVVGFKETMARRHPRVANTEAWVSVAIWVDENGSVEWAEVSDSSGSELLDRVALALFTDVVAFRPALDRGDRVPKSMLFYLLFPW